MAIAEIEKFRSIVPFLLKSKDVWTHYDNSADVLYIHFKKPNVADDSEQLDKNTIVRYDEKGEIIGVTFLHAGRDSKPRATKAKAIKSLPKKHAAKRITRSKILKQSRKVR
jgi:uncharacterized protein YuzE